MRVCVIVLGDIGRSPRMKYHSLSLAEKGFKVDLVGYGGTNPDQLLLENPNIAIKILSDIPQFTTKLPRIIGYGFKVMWQFFSLFFTLLSLSKPTHVLVQNPPSVPMLTVVWLFCTIRSCKMIVDWHNYGFTILGITLGISHPLVRISKWLEMYFGRKAHANLCVTKAMQIDLKNKWQICAQVLYDRPADCFRSIDLVEKHNVLTKMATEHSCFLSKNRDCDSTAFTRASGNEVELTDDRPVLLVSSTSWTEDEDFGILLAALQEYDDSFSLNENKGDFPDILCVITGKGPMKSFYEGEISARKFSHISFCMPWLTAADYPKLLACADLGVCLHTSSSGLDLPMKVVDMFGCGLPVLAYDFQCLSELVENGKNGLVFSNSKELTQRLKELLKDFPKHSPQLATFRDNLQTFQQLRWNECWNLNALPLFN